jgi:toxin ParE1/3/4
MRVVWTAPAARDLEGIGDYIARQNPRPARRTVQHIRARTRALAAHPYLARRVYGVINDRIEILAVFHGARIWPDTF